MSFEPREYLRHMLAEADYLIAAGHQTDRSTFLNDETLKRAFVRSLEIIGEAAKKLPYDFRDRYTHIEWRSIAGLRDRLIHGYFGVDYELVWDVVTNKVPRLKLDLDRVLSDVK